MMTWARHRGSVRVLRPLHRVPLHPCLPVHRRHSRATIDPVHLTSLNTDPEHLCHFSHWLPKVSPINGRSYHVLEHSSWSDGEAMARVLGGHLATTPSRVDNRWILRIFGSAGHQNRDL